MIAPFTVPRIRTSRAALSAVLVLGLLVLATLGVTSPVASQNNAISAENRNAGSSGWNLDRPSDDNSLQIKGYTGATSANQGERLSFHVSVSSAQMFRIEIYRMGWYGGAGGRLVETLGPFAGKTQPAPKLDTATGMVTASWPVTTSIDVPRSWVTGAYIAKLVRSDGYDNHIPFVIRDDSGTADILVQLPHTTYQAYNNFPADGRIGKSLYDYSSAGGERATHVSFDRPYADHGAGQFFDYDYPAIRWLERRGYNLSYSTSIDTHAKGERLLNHRVFLSLGHDEYWTGQMYDGAETARNAPETDLAFLGANNLYWRIDLQPSASGTPNRVVFTDRNFNVDRWRQQGRPEQQLLGVQYLSPFSFDYQPLVVADAGSFAWADSGLSNGSSIPGLAGYEIDGLDPAHPGPPTANQRFLTASPFEGNMQRSSLYRHYSGSWVFSAGTLNWSWGLGNPRQPGLESPAIQAATANILDRMVRTAPGAGDPSIAAASSLAELTAALDYEPSTHGDVLRLYRAFFNREPDVSGARYWIEVRDTRSLTQISGYFTGSAEYAKSYAGTDDREFLTTVYRNVLGRQYDQAGFDYWLDILGGTNATGSNPRRERAARGSVVRFIAASEEFRQRFPYHPR